MTIDTVLNRIKKVGVVPILRKFPEDAVLEAVDAVVKAGVSMVEITLDSPGANRIIQTLRDRYEEKVLVAAGTVLTSEQVKESVEHGAQVLISPHLDLSLVTLANDLGVPMIPGVITPTEIMQAFNAGVSVLKLFPAAQLGSGYLKNLLGPFSNISFIPTGGITPENAGEFIRAGAVGVGLGSSLIQKQDIGKWDDLTERTMQVLRTVNGILGR